MCCDSRGAASHKWIKYKFAGKRGNLDKPGEKFHIFYSGMPQIPAFEPGCAVSGFGIVRPEPAGVEPGLIFFPGISSDMIFRSGWMTVLQECRLLKYPSAFLAENYPFSIICIAAMEIAASADIPLFYHQAVFYLKASCCKALIMPGISVEPGEKISVPVRLQYPVAFFCQFRIIEALIALNQFLLLMCEMILVIDSVWRIRQNQIRRCIRNPGKEMKTVTAVNMVGKISIYSKQGRKRDVCLSVHYADSPNFVLIMRYRFVDFGK